MRGLLDRPRSDRPLFSGGRLLERLSFGVDPASLAVFRIGFGAILVWEVWRKYDIGIVRLAFVEPHNHFTWWPFDWVRPYHGVGTYLTFAIIAAAAALVAVGLFYRAAAAVLWLGLTYWFLWDKTQYINHHYLSVLIAFLLIFVPANAAYALDGRRKPRLPSPTVPAWSLWLIRFQVGVPYFFAGLAKLNFDWLVRGEPLRTWMANNTDFPLFGRFFTQEPLVRAFGWGSTVFDLTVPFLLLHRRTRAPAFAVALAFHLMNSRLFGLGMFPWLMIVATTIFFAPDWPRRMADVLRRGPNRKRAVVVAGFGFGFAIGAVLPRGFSGVMAVIAGFGVAVLFFHLLPTRPRRPAAPSPAPADASTPGAPLRRLLVAFLAIWAAVQILLPLRHFVIPGNANWTEDGNRFAWHLLLKDSRVRFSVLVTDRATGERWEENVRRHVERIQEMRLKTPDMFLQLAHWIDSYHEERGRDVRVRVRVVKSMNRRPFQPFIDPTVDLTKVRGPYVPPADWVVPLEPYDSRR